MQFANEFKYRPVQLGLYVNISTASTLSQHLVQRDTESPPLPQFSQLGGSKNIYGADPVLLKLRTKSRDPPHTWLTHTQQITS